MPAFLNPSLGAAAPFRLTLRLQDGLGVLAHPFGAPLAAFGFQRFTVLAALFELVIVLVCSTTLVSLGVCKDPRTPALAGNGRVSHRRRSFNFSD
jgi:hypothetical protein